MNRRDLVQKVLLGGTVLLVVPSVLQSCTKDPAIDPNNSNPTGGIPPVPGTKIDLDLGLAENSSLNTKGSSKIVKGVLIINSGDDNFIALSSICTHQGCTVEYNSSANNIQCPCHGSTFSTMGSVVTGPAVSALRSYSISKTGNILSISV